MERRKFIAWAGSALALPVLSLAQQPGRVYRLGIMGFGESDAFRRSIDPFIRMLGPHGFVEGKNLEVVLKVAPSESSALEPAVTDLIAAKCDLIIVPSQKGAVALKGATSKTPIIAVLGSDPVAAGLVKSMARPGANVTGVTVLSIETGRKRLELLKEIFPATRRVYYLNQKANMHFFETDGARKLGMVHEAVAVEDLRDFEKFFARSPASGEAVNVAISTQNFVMCRSIVALANRAKMPAIYPFTECADAGGLIAYAGDLGAAMARAMEIAARIFKGANPAEIPFEQSMRLSLVINLRTARELGVAIPQPVLLRADRVIE